MLESHTYDFAFVPHAVEPEIVFIIKTEHLEALRTRLESFVHDIANEANEYFQSHGSEFFLFEQELFDCVFGYGRCGYATPHDDETWLRVKLGRGWRIFEATFTIHVLSRILLAPFTAEPTNRGQQIELYARADRTAPGWGHMLGGQLSAPVIHWLRDYAEKNESWPGTYWSTPMHPEVLSAMRNVWQAMSHRELREYSNEANGVISREGRFILQCFGNACDIAIYPDSPMYEEEGYAQFSCHNLDSADQQLTLLAGLIKILELARASP